ncbi:acyloxyacyl hydrolase [Microvirga makkahensis]|uniref:Acyloxyacyl hydrolase n=1 Tax=Microvirga makkahensis TaxID=1128670 RepID=A0A7X3MWZ0_9HYPH|nr:acyloxyacyl hydrolase [Microvirga makkahensis]MXQ14757.1 acyloxyacyl hydrolase [Microvirga makkahensis]
MHVSRAIGLSLSILLAGSTSLLAADARKQSAQPSILSEFRIGFSAQDPWGSEGDDGSANLTGEILLAKPFTASDLFTSYFIPRPHFGGSLNFDGRTDFAYTGLTWTVDVTPSLFVEGSIGGAFHNGKKDANDPFSDRRALGCSPLFRESGSVGVRLSANWSVVATIEHLSSAGSCSENRGLTNIGARVGYSF